MRAEAKVTSLTTNSHLYAGEPLGAGAVDVQAAVCPRENALFGRKLLSCCGGGTVAGGVGACCGVGGGQQRSACVECPQQVTSILIQRQEVAVGQADQELRRPCGGAPAVGE